MSTKNPADEARAVLERARPFFNELIGVERTSKIFDEMAGDVGGMLAAPQTWFARIQDAVLDGMKGRSAEELGLALLPHLFPMATLNADLTAQNATDDAAAVASSPGATAIVDFLCGAAAQLGADLVLAETKVIGWPGDFAKVLATSAPPKIGDGEQIVFETWARSMAANIQHWAETIYRPLLSSLLRITRLLRGDQAQDPNELGAIMAICRDLWSHDHPALISVLNDEVRIIRNSEAHRDTEIDPRAETITFTNRPRNRPPEMLGPLDRATFGEITASFFRLMPTLLAAFREAERRITPR